MAVNGIYLICPVIVVGVFLIGMFLLRYYARISCGYFHGKERLDGKTVIITGATGGIGKETTRELAKRGARVVMACRNMELGKQIREEIVDTTKNEDVILKKVDLSSQKSIRQFAKDIIQTESHLDVLIHNAATGEVTFNKTEDDLELHMATNHFGPFLLTHLLIDLLRNSAPSRIIVVASAFYRVASLNLNNLNPSSFWCPAYYYFVSKYANISFTFELARRLKSSNVTANCLHPGLIDTGIWRYTPFPLNHMLRLIIIGFFKTPVQGCQTTVLLACSREVEGVTGKYFSDCAESTVGKGARDECKAKTLWELCVKFANLKETDPKI